MIRILKYLKSPGFWRLIGLTLLAAQIFTAAMVAALEMMFKGYVPAQGLIIGAVSALVITPVIATVFYGLMVQFRSAAHVAAQKASHYRSVIDAIADGYYEVDLKGRFIFFNDALCEILGSTRIEMTDATYREVIHFVESEQLYRIFAGIYKTGKPVGGIPWLFTRKGGLQRHVEGSASLIVDANANPVGFRGTVRDVTRERQAREAIRESEEKYRGMLEGIDDAYYEADLSGNLTYFNDALCCMLGYSTEELVLMNNRRFMEPASLNDVFQTFNRVFRTDVAAKGSRWVLLAKDGSRCHVESSVSLMKDASGQPVGFQGIARDISHRIEAEKDLKQAKEAAETANEIKSEFLANMSHEIRTPLNGIIGMCDLALGTEMTPRQSEYLNIIRSSGNSLLALINDLLDFSKIEAGKLRLEQIPFNLTAAVEEIPDIFLDEISRKSIELVLGLDPELPETVTADPLRLRQVLVNLISNAVKFTDSGEIVVSARPLKITGSRTEIFFSVRDTGIGIAAENQSKLFDSFTQADGSTTRKYGGTGLGLAISKQIVSLMGGRIWVESRVGVGSTFCFTANFLNASTLPSVAFDRQPIFLGRRVLIIDDNDSVRRTLGRHLTRCGFQVEETGDGEKGTDCFQQALKQDRFDLILLDADMKKVVSLCQRLVRMAPRVRPTVVLMGPNGNDGLLEEARAGGRFLVLSKPVKPTALIKILAEAFSGAGPLPGHGEDRAKKGMTVSQTRILLVEDNAINRRVAMEMLTAAGMTVDCAENGLEALAAVRNRRFDAVLMDVQMPKMDGLEATRRMRRDLNLTDLPIIALTAHAMGGDKKKCMDAGMNGHIAKPIDRTALIATLDRLINPDAHGDAAAADPPPLPPPAAPAPGVPLEAPGLNLAEGLERLGGDWDLYLELLGEYCHAYGDFGNQFKRFKIQGDMAAARRHAHSLKGAAGNLAATDLFLAAQSLEQACRNIDMNAIERHLPAVESALAQVICSRDRMAAATLSDNDPAPKVRPLEPNKNGTEAPRFSNRKIIQRRLTISRIRYRVN